MENKRWYQILAHGVGPPDHKGKQQYESEVFNIEGDYVVFDNIVKMRAFIDNMNILISSGGTVLGKRLPFVILEIQSTPPKLNAEATTEEWYVYNMSHGVYINVGNMGITEAIDTYNSFNKELI